MIVTFPLDKGALRHVFGTSPGSYHSPSLQIVHGMDSMHKKFALILFQNNSVSSSNSNSSSSSNGSSNTMEEGCRASSLQYVASSSCGACLRIVFNYCSGRPVCVCRLRGRVRLLGNLITESACLFTALSPLLSRDALSELPVGTRPSYKADG